MMNQPIDKVKIKKLFEVFRELSSEDQAYIIGYITHMAEVSELTKKKGA
jgi:hypothetical protein